MNFDREAQLPPEFDGYRLESADGLVIAVEADDSAPEDDSVEDYTAAIEDTLQDPDTRQDIWDYTVRVCDYLKREQIASIVLIDRRARVIGTAISEYWKLNRPDQARPDIFFINPDGFMTLDDTPRERMDRRVGLAIMSGEPSKPAPRDTYAEVDIEMCLTYTRLMDQRDQPILLFDTCCHTANTIDEVKKSFDRLGFADCRFGVLAVEDSTTDSYPIDFIASRKPAQTCNTFIGTRSIEKNYHHVYSDRATDPALLAESRLIRSGVRDIIRERSRRGKLRNVATRFLKRT